jgi:hypothetical protein
VAVSTVEQSSPLSGIMRWLTRYAGFPARRLDKRAELLLLISAAAAHNEGEFEVANGGPVEKRLGARDAALRAHAMRRSQVHFRCDNSAKV